MDRCWLAIEKCVSVVIRMREIIASDACLQCFPQIRCNAWRAVSKAGEPPIKPLGVRLGVFATGGPMPVP
jgi:hypothetical protein